MCLYFLLFFYLILFYHIFIFFSTTQFTSIPECGIQTLNPGCRGSSHFSPLDAVLDPVYRPGIAPDTLKDLSCPSPLAPDTLDGSPHSSLLAPAFNPSQPQTQIYCFFSDSFELIQLFPIPNQTVEQLQSFST